MMTCALKTQSRSRAICKDETQQPLQGPSPLEQPVDPDCCCGGHCWLWLGPVPLLCSQRQCCSQRPILWHSALGPVRGFFQSILPSLELSKRTISPPSKEEPQELLGASSSALCLPMPSFPSRLPALNQPPPCTGYFPYYRTEAGICTGPLERTESFTRIEILEIKEGGQRAGSSVWSLRGSCLVSWEERRDFVDADVKEKLLKPMTTWKSAWIWIKWKYSFSQKKPQNPNKWYPRLCNGSRKKQSRSLGNPIKFL